MAKLSTAADVHAFWFGDVPWGHSKMWFEAGDTLDDEVERRFLPTVEAALRGALDGWADETRSGVCLIVVLDQFTRHVFRGTPRFVAGDSRAQELAVRALDEGWDRRLRSDEAMFLAMPLQHAEDRQLQRRSVAEARRLAAADARLEQLEKYAVQHAQIVERFGRFPDRNRVLGRPSTPEEQRFLAEVHLPWFEPQ